MFATFMLYRHSLKPEMQENQTCLMLKYVKEIKMTIAAKKLQ